MPHLPFITLEENSSLPLYRQIYEAIRQAILSGKFYPAMPLPSSRLMAKDLCVARMTVINAYDQLLAEGYVETKNGAGTFVASSLPEDLLQTPYVERQIDRTEISSREIKFSAYGEHLTKIDFESWNQHGTSLFAPFQQGVPAVDKFPFDVWDKIARKWQKKPPSSFLGYNHPVGYEPLRRAIAGYLASARGIRCTPGQVIIINGTQQGLDLISRVFLERGDEVLTEDPCYLGARNVFTAIGARLISVPIDKEGFDLEAAQKKSRKAKLVYVTPSHQYPLGITMSLARRINLLEWARETGSFIIEDDYNSEFRYASRPHAALQGLDNDGRVIYLGTFSKTIFPALRLGCLVVPPDLINVFMMARAIADLQSPIIEQAILAEFIADGHFARHIRRMRALYEERQQILVTEAEKHLAGILEVAPAASGMHLIGWLPEGVNDREASHRVSEAGVKAPPISALCIEEKLRDGLFLGYAAFNERQIKDGVKRLAQALKNYLKEI